MRVIVCGSRTWHWLSPILERLEDLPKDTVIVHGDARGADCLADLAAAQIGLKIERYMADWSKYGRRAGSIRNAEMLATGVGLVIAFRCSGESRGTDDMVRRARAAGVHVELYHEEGRSGFGIPYLAGPYRSPRGL